MAQQPKRLPGEANPQPDADAPMRTVRAGESLNAHGPFGSGDGLGLAAGITAFMDWRKRRRARKNRTS